MPSYPSGFYVYTLADPLEPNRPFYIGKGVRDRAWQHERAVRRSNPANDGRKAAKIRSVINRGSIVRISIVAEYKDERDALAHEAQLIRETPDNFNVLPGVGMPDLNGIRFGKLKVIGDQPQMWHGGAHWLCRCDCGNVISVSSAALIQYLSRSCGCTKKSKRRSSKSAKSPRSPTWSGTSAGIDDDFWS